MAFNDKNKLGYSYKKSINKAHTQENFSANEEPIASNLSISYTTIFGESITQNPISNDGLISLYSNNNIVERVKFEIEIIPDTQIGINQSQGYRLKLPSDYSTNGALKSVFSSGDYLHESLGRLQLIPPMLGEVKTNGTTEYDPILYKQDGISIIPKFDSINWSLDYYNGVLFIQNPPAAFDVSSNRPGYVTAYLYVGKYLSDITYTGGTITGGSYVTIDNFNTYTGETETHLGDIDSAISGLTSTLLTKQDILSAGKGISNSALNNDKIELDLSNYISESNINITLSGSTTAKITDIRSIKKGFEYDADYTNDYTSLSLVHKGYVDTLAQGLRPRFEVVAASTSSVDLFGGSFSGILDSVTINDGDRVLIKNQGLATQNGIYNYIASTNTFIRATDMDTSPSGETKQGDFVTVVNGTTQGLTQWVIISPNPIDVEIDDIIFSLLTKPSSYTPGNGISISGNTISVDGSDIAGNLLNWDGSQLNVESDSSKLNTSEFSTYSGSTELTLVAINSELNNINGIATGNTESINTIENIMITGATKSGNGNTLIDKVENNQIFIKSISGGSNVNIDIIDNTLILNSTATGETATTIGLSESSGTTYNDGLFTDFTNNTLIGTPIDRFNKILKYLTPTSPSNLTSINSISSFASGILSFGATLNNIGYSNVDGSAGNSVVDINGLYSISGTRLGIIQGDVEGILNSGVNGDVSGIPYLDYAIGNADSGILSFELNGVIIDSIDLSTSTSILNGLILSVSEVKNVKFNSGDELDLFKYRTGTYYLPVSEMDNGFNYLRITHVDGSKGINVVTNYLEWVYDSDINNISVSGENIVNITLLGSKKISGVEYNTSGSVDYTAVVSNVYRNVYSDLSNAISFTNKTYLGSLSDIYIIGDGINNRNGGTLTSLPTLDTSTVLDPESRDINITATFPIDGTVLLGNQANVSTGIEILHPISSKSFSGGTATDTNFLIYNVVQVPNLKNEDFIGETYRLISDNYLIINYSNINNGFYFWDSTQSLLTGSSGHTTGLLVFAGKLVYPKSSYLNTEYGILNGNFSSITYSPINNVNYSTVTGIKDYYRMYKADVSSTLASLTFEITHNGTSSNFLTNGGDTGLPVNNDIKFEFLIKRSNGESYGWANPFATLGNPYGIQNTLISHLGSVTTVTCTLSTLPRVSNGDIIIVRLKTSELWSNYISNIKISNI